MLHYLAVSHNRPQSASNGLSVVCLLFIVKDLISLKIFQSYPASRCCLDFICNLFALDLTALSRIKETALLSSGEKKNVLGQATRSLQGRVAQLRIKKSIGAMQFM